MNATLAMMEKWEKSNAIFERKVVDVLNRWGVTNQSGWEIETLMDLDDGDPDTTATINVARNVVRWNDANPNGKGKRKVYTKTVRGPNGDFIQVPLTPEDWKGPAQKRADLIGKNPGTEVTFNDVHSQVVLPVYDCIIDKDFDCYSAIQYKGTLYTVAEWKKMNANEAE